MNTPDEWTPEERRLHDALNRAAEQVTPGPDGLARIRRRIADTPRWRSPVLLGLAAATATAAAVVVGGVVLLGNDDSSPVASPSTDSSTAPPTDGSPTSDEPTPSLGSDNPTSPAPSDGASPTTPSGETSGQAPVRAAAVPVYYVTETDAGSRLAREFHGVETSTPIAAALTEMLGAADDPDYSTLWSQQTRISSAEVADGVLVVDLAAPPQPASMSSEQAQLATQQLVYTATATASTLDLDASSVRVLVDGEPVTDLFGVDASAPLERADPMQVRQLVQINNPTEGATVDSPVTVDGEAAAFEANVPWEIRRDGAVVDAGAATATECCRLAPFSFEVELEPGTYEVVVTESDPSGGQGRPPMTDTRTFTVE